jgi:iron complex outermembrane recepter protein
VAVVKVGREETASSTHLHSEELAAVPMRTAEDALRLVPGLIAVQHGSEGKGHQFFLRGFDAQHGSDLEVDVEGIPLNEWSNVHAQGYLDLAFLPTATIRQVNVAKGSFDLEQGAFGIAGSASYRLGIAERERGTRVAYTFGSTLRNRLLASYTPPTGDGSQFAAVELVHDQGFGMSRQARRASALGQVHLIDDARRGTLSLLALLHAGDFELPGLVRVRDVQAGRLGFYDSYSEAAKGSSTRAIVALIYERERARHELRATAYGGYRGLELLENFTGDLLDPVNGDFRLQHQQGALFGARATWDVRLAPTLWLATSAGARGDVLAQREARVRADESLVERRRELDALQLATHLAVGVRYRPWSPLRIEVGTRLDVFSVGVRDDIADTARTRPAQAALSPRVRVGLRLSPAVRLIAAYGQGVRPPEARAFTRFRPQETGLGEERAGTGSPRITRAHTTELGARFFAAIPLTIDLSTFVTRVARESVFDHVSGINLELNGTRRLGAELVVRASPWPWLQLSGDLTGVDARFIESGRRVPLAPWLTGGARVVLSHASGFDAGLRLLVVAPRPLPHDARGEALYMTDATAGYRYRFVRVDLALENLLFRKLREGEYHFASHWYADEPRSQVPSSQYVAGPPFNARLTLTATF